MRTSLRIVPVAAAMTIAATLMACMTPDLTGSATCRQGSETITIFQGPSGNCIPRTRIVGFGCAGQAPEIVLDAGSAHERRFLGGGFATRLPHLPASAEVLGVGNGTQVVVTPDDDRWLFTVRGTDVERWLKLPEGDAMSADGAQAFMVGDSILYGGQHAMTAALPEWTVSVDALNGRGSASGVPIVQAQEGAGHDAVVVELGTNDESVDAFRDAARQTLTSLRDAPLVIWQTVKGPEDVVQADEINGAIRELAATRPNVAIADWAELVADEELGYDGIHPAEEHQDAMARIVAPMLTRWWNATMAAEPGCRPAAEQA